jgi:hypothetical protein
MSLVETFATTAFAISAVILAAAVVCILGSLLADWWQRDGGCGHE